MDQNGIMLSSKNTNQKNYKRIRGSQLLKHYDIIPADEEYGIRQELINSKLMITY